MASRAETRHGAAHVVMVVANPVHHDARVRKSAASAARAGYRVTVLGVAPEGAAPVEQLDGFELRNITVTPHVQDLLRARRVRRRRLLVPLAFHDRDEAVAAVRLRNVADQQTESLAGRAAAARAGGRPDRLLEGQVALRRSVGRLRRRVVYARNRLRHLAESPRLLRVGPFGRVQQVMLHTRWFGGWRRQLPEQYDLEATFGHELDQLDADLVHAHDVHLLGVAARAVDRARLRGRATRLVYDAHEFVPGLTRYGPERIRGWASIEEEYAGRADAVITVSEPIAELLASRLGLPERPAVVLNTPVLGQHAHGPVPDLRALAGVGADEPLAVYSGNIGPDRGVVELVDVLALVPGLHAVIVTNAGPENRFVAGLVEAAGRAGTAERLHFVPYVATSQLVAFLSAATVGVHGLSQGPVNHELALPNKFFDYLHAGLPVVTSGVATMARLTRELGVGEVWTAGDAQSLAAALNRVLADPQRYRDAAMDPGVRERFSWQRQEKVLLGVYARLLDR